MIQKVAQHAPPRLADEVAYQARRLGLPLGTVEMLQAEPKIARDFLRAVRAGRVRRFLDALDLVALERALAARELRAPRFSPGALVGFF